jgi:transposase
MASLVDKLVPDDLGAIVEPLLPPPPRPPYGGRHRTIPERNCLAALVFMARTSTPWALLPAKELGCGSASTAWRRLDQWAKAGVFDQLHLEVLDRLGLAAGWTGHGPAWTRPACVPNVGGPRGRKSCRPWQAGIQAPSGQ